MTTVRVIVLAQGEQKRLPDLKVPKQLLKLPACGDVTILRRTLIQVGHILHHNLRRDPEAGPSVTVVCGDVIVNELHADINEPIRPRLVTLGDPGNSSLKGIHRYLTDTSTRVVNPVADHNVVLLGDVVYSWACLSVLLEPFDAPTAGIKFCGTNDLSASGGELWGVSWNDIADDQMMTMLDRAVRKHPPFTAYQPGQMRRWLWEHPENDSRVARLAASTVGKVAALQETDEYVAIDDYTRDIDLPEHVANLFPLSERAAADDRENGVVW